MMFRMDFDITIGRYRLKMIDSVKIKHSVEQLSDTAAITLPAMVEGSALKVEDKLTAGDEVTINLGYDDNLKTEFKGYLKAINTDAGNLTLECEDAIYLFDKSLKDEEMTEISLKALLEDVCSQIDPSYNVECAFDFTWEKFTIYRATGCDVLKKIQEETKANIFFDGQTLHVQPQYADVAGDTVVYDFTKNIETSNLKYRKASDRKVEVTIEITNPDGTKKEIKYGSTGGKSVKRIVSSISESQAQKVAENEFNMWCYDGYEGSFTGWLVPYVEPGFAVKLRDKDYEYKEGVYYVTGTEIDFSANGGKRIVKLGRRIG